jgi:hypothetical protein
MKFWRVEFQKYLRKYLWGKWKLIFITLCKPGFTMDPYTITSGESFPYPVFKKSIYHFEACGNVVG